MGFISIIIYFFICSGTSNLEKVDLISQLQLYNRIN